jgi:15-cis-phytoene synthase
LRPAFDALFDIDDALSTAVGSTTQPALAAIKVAWWREALEKLDCEAAPPEPRLQAAAGELLPRGISGADLAQLEQSRVALLQENPDPEHVLQGGTHLFLLAGRLLSITVPEFLEISGRVYAAGKVVRTQHPAPLDLFVVTDSPTIPIRLRALTGLAVLAKRDLRRAPDLEPEATPARAWALLRHRLTGRL